MKKSNIGLMAIVTLTTTVLLTAALGFGCDSGDMIQGSGMHVPKPQNNPSQPESFHYISLKPFYAVGAVKRTEPLDPKAEKKHLTISPDGNWQLFSSVLPGEEEESSPIILLNKDGRLWSFNGDPSWAHFSPDSKILEYSWYESATDGDSAIYAVRLDQPEKARRYTNLPVGYMSIDVYLGSMPGQVSWSGDKMKCIIPEEAQEGMTEIQINLQTGDTDVIRYPKTTKK